MIALAVAAVTVFAMYLMIWLPAQKRRGENYGLLILWFAKPVAGFIELTLAVFQTILKFTGTNERVSTLLWLLVILAGALIVAVPKQVG